MTIDKLAGVRLKLARAHVHFNSFKKFPARLSKDNSRYGRQEYNHKLGQYEFYTEDEWLLDETIPLVIGDVLNNARSVLDHVAYLLARNPSRRTGFPIFQGAPAFKRYAGRQMVTMKLSAKKIIQRLQSYQRPDGLYSLWWLHELNNIDKHRALLVAAIGVAGSAATGGFDDHIPIRFPNKRLKRGEVFMTAKAPFEPKRQYNYLAIGEIRLLDAPVDGRMAEWVLYKILDDIENKLLPAFGPSDFP
jgi:hypothetical protein